MGRGWRKRREGRRKNPNDACVFFVVFFGKRLDDGPTTVGVRWWCRTLTPNRVLRCSALRLHCITALQLLRTIWLL